MNDGRTIFDDARLCERLGLVNSGMAMKVLRALLNNNDKLPEGKCAEKAFTRLFRPEWKPIIEGLHALGYVTFEGTGHAASRIVLLTGDAKAWLQEQGITVQADQPTV